jgi:hypothetical protein
MGSPTEVVSSTSSSTSLMFFSTDYISCLMTVADRDDTGKLQPSLYCTTRMEITVHAEPHEMQDAVKNPKAQIQISFKFRLNIEYVILLIILHQQPSRLPLNDTNGVIHQTTLPYFLRSSHGISHQNEYVHSDIPSSRSTSRTSIQQYPAVVNSTRAVSS